MFGWWTRWRRKQIRARPLSPNLQREAMQVWQWSFVPAAKREQALEWMKVFVASRYWEGCNHLKLTEAMQWNIASQVALMTLAYPDWYFDNVPTILLYPEAYVAPNATQTLAGGFAIVGGWAREGEAWYRGPVILNWRDVRAASLNAYQGRSLVVHEFSHQMDMANSRTADGEPPLPANVDPIRWRQVFQDSLQQSRDYVAAGHSLLINDYGLTNEGEFFAVASELYFQLPHELGHYHPDVMQLLLDFYQVDWREWLPRNF